MPGINRRRELDSRGDRFESEVRHSELVSPDLWKNRTRLYTCKRCGVCFEEASRTCPRCDKKDQMGYLTQIRERDRDEARNKAIERARRKYAD